MDEDALTASGGMFKRRDGSPDAGALIQTPLCSSSAGSASKLAVWDESCVSITLEVSPSGAGEGGLEPSAFVYAAAGSMVLMLCVDSSAFRNHGSNEPFPMHIPTASETAAVKLKRTAIFHPCLDLPERAVCTLGLLLLGPTIADGLRGALVCNSAGVASRSTLGGTLGG